MKIENKHRSMVQENVQNPTLKYIFTFILYIYTLLTWITHAATF